MKLTRKGKKYKEYHISFIILITIENKTDGKWSQPKIQWEYIMVDKGPSCSKHASILISVHWTEQSGQFICMPGLFEQVCLPSGICSSRLNELSENSTIRWRNFCKPTTP